MGRMLRTRRHGGRPPSATSAPTVTVGPRITNVLQDGVTIAYTPAVASGSPEPVIVHTMTVNGVAEALSYVFQAADVGRQVAITATATNGVGSPSALADGAIVQDVLAAPTWGLAPVISGTPTVGVAAAYTAGEANGNPVPVITYEFLLDDVSQGASFTPASGDSGKTLKVRGTAANSQGSAQSTSAGVVIQAAVGSAAPVYMTGYAGRPVILGQPYPGATVTILTGQRSTNGNPAPSVTYQWYRTDDMGLTSEAITGATSNSYTCTYEDYMQEIYVTETATNIAGTASVSSYRVRVLPAAGYNAKQHAGITADAGEVNDPDTALAYSATTLYRAGDVVSSGGLYYYARQPFTYGRAPAAGSSTKWWQRVGNVWYIDTSAASNGVGTKASPFNTLEEVRKRVNLGVSGYTLQPQGTLFLFKRGTSISGSFRVAHNGSGYAGRYLFGAYGSGARPAFTWAPPPDSVVAASGIYGDIIYFHGSSSTSAASGCRAHNLSVTGGIRTCLRAVPGSGTFAVNDAVSFSGGATGTVVAVSVWSGFTYYTVALATRDSLVNGYAETMTKSGASATFGNRFYSGGISMSQGVTDIGMSNCNASYCELGGLGGTGTTNATLPDDSTYPADFFQLNCLCEHCGLAIWNGAGGGAFAGVKNMKAWWNTVRDCGYLNGSHNHQMYTGKLSHSSILFTRLENTTATKYGNHAFVYHGNSHDMEVAWCYCKGTSSGIGINDGNYGPTAYEQMYDVHLHHNFLEGHTTISWDIACLVRSRIHNNVTVNSAPSSFVDRRYEQPLVSLLQDMVLAHNTFFNSPFYLGLFAGGRLSRTTDVVNDGNIYSGTAASTVFYKSYDLANAELLQDGNWYYRQDGSTVIRWNNGGSGGTAPANYTSASALATAAPGFEGSGQTGNPLFANTGTGDFSLQGGSSAKTGAPDRRRQLGYAADHIGATRGADSSFGAFA